MPDFRPLAAACLVAATAACGPDGPAAANMCAGDPATRIGGAFQLVDQAGRPADQEVLAGRYALIYFGFTFCPDICPIEMQKISVAMRLLEDRGADLSSVQPVFISVDPERDRPEVVKDFLTLYHPDFIGLTGSPEQVARAAKVYRVYFQKEGEGEYYSVNHSSLIFAMDPNGHYLTHFTAEDDAEQIADRLEPCL
ncbi:MAG: SCO family protein [Rhodothalassiaceae bacterium]